MMEHVSKRPMSWVRQTARRIRRGAAGVRRQASIGAAALTLSLAAAGSAMAHGHKQGVPSPTWAAPVTTWAHAPRTVAAPRPTGIAPVKTVDGRPVLGVLHMVATAYGPTYAANYPYGPVDAYGQPLQPGMVAVDPSVIPMRSTLYVQGYHDPALPAGGFVGHAMDTGDAIQGQRIDIFMNQGRAAVSHFGVEPVTVYVLGVHSPAAP